MEALSLFNRGEYLAPGRDPNPCVRTYGRGPAGVRCRDCGRLYFRRTGSRRYYKCFVRPATYSQATDHRVGWNACAEFRRKES